MHCCLYYLRLARDICLRFYYANLFSFCCSFSFQRTESVLKTTGEKTASVFGSITSGITSKFSQMKNSESMRSIEASVGSAYENVKVSYEQNNFLCQSHAVTTILLYIYTYLFYILLCLCSLNTHLDNYQVQQQNKYNTICSSHSPHSICHHLGTL